MIRTEQLTKKYKTLSGDVLATDHVDLHFSCNGLYMILGKSGCGKTTLLNILSGLDSHDKGHIYVDGVDIGSYHEAELDNYRNLKMGVIFQEYNLISELTVWDNLRIVLEIQDWDNKSEATIQSLIEETLAKVGLNGYESRRINQLSGGERQRVAVARTLIKRPNIIFADEPTGNLDSKTGKVIFELLSEIAKEYVVIVVTHDRDSAFRYGDTIIEMENGHIANVEQQVKSKQNFHFTHYNADASIPPVGLSSDGTPPQEEIINGITMYTLKEDDQFSATFIYQNTVYVFFSRDLNYDECYKVVSSLAAVKE